MRQRALHAAAGATAPDGHAEPAVPATNRAERNPTPSEFGLPACPTPDHGLVPTGTATTDADGPFDTVETQRFRSVPLRHEISLAVEETGPTLTATLTNTSEQPWAYRVPRGPAPFSGGRVESDAGEIRARPFEDDDLFSDGVLRSGESVSSELSLSTTSSPDARLPRGEHTLLQPIRVWNADEVYGYNWQITLVA